MHLLTFNAGQLLNAQYLLVLFQRHYLSHLHHQRRDLAAVALQ